MYFKIISCKIVINALKTEHKLKNSKHKTMLNVCVHMRGVIMMVLLYSMKREQEATASDGIPIIGTK